MLKNISWMALLAFVMVAGSIVAIALAPLTAIYLAILAVFFMLAANRED